MSIDIEILTTSKITNFSKICPNYQKCPKKCPIGKYCQIGKKIVKFWNGLEWSQLKLDPNPDVDCQSVLTCCWEAALLLRDKFGENQAPRNIYRNKRGPFSGQRLPVGSLFSRTFYLPCNVESSRLMI